MGILGSASGSGGRSTPSLWNRLRTGPGMRPQRITKGNTGGQYGQGTNLTEGNTYRGQNGQLPYSQG